MGNARDPTPHKTLSLRKFNRRTTPIANISTVMSRGGFNVEATNRMFSNGASGIQQKAIAYRDPDVQRNDNDLALVPQSPQGSGVKGAVANVPRKLVLERETVREATGLQTAVTAGAFNIYNLKIVSLYFAARRFLNHS